MAIARKLPVGVAPESLNRKALSTLARGYSVTTATDGNVLKKVKQVKAGEMLTTRLEDGWIESEVKNIQPVKKSRKKVH